MQYFKNLIMVFGMMAVVLCGCGRQVSLITGEAQEEVQMTPEDTDGETTGTEQSGTSTAEPSVSEIPEEGQQAEQPELVAVYVCGAVRQPGVYYVAGSAIRETAVCMAGGFSDDADAAYVNLAQTVAAGEQIYIPTLEETTGISLSERDAGATSAQPHASADTNAESNGRININTAGKEMLMTLPGIGESKADAIIAYREARGKFQSTEELMQIRGIKEGIYNQIKDLIIVG